MQYRINFIFSRERDSTECLVKMFLITRSTLVENHPWESCLSPNFLFHKFNFILSCRFWWFLLQFSFHFIRAFLGDVSDTMGVDELLNQLRNKSKKKKNVIIAVIPSQVTHSFSRALWPTSTTFRQLGYSRYYHISHWWRTVPEIQKIISDVQKWREKIFWKENNFTFQ